MENRMPKYIGIDRSTTIENQTLEIKEFVITGESKNHDVIINNCQINSNSLLVDLQINQSLNSLTILGSGFHTDLRIINRVNIKKIKINNSDFKGKLIIQDSTIGKIEIKDSTIKKIVIKNSIIDTIDSNSRIDSFTIHNAKGTSIRIKELTPSEIKFQNAFFEEVQFEDVQGYNQSIDIYYDNTIIASPIFESIKDNPIYTDYTITDCSTNKISLHSDFNPIEDNVFNDFIDKFRISCSVESNVGNSYMVHFSTQNINYERLHISNKRKPNSIKSITIDNTKVNDFKLSNINGDTTIELYNFSALGGADSSFQVENSDLSKAVCWSLDLRDFSTIRFKKTLIEKARFHLIWFAKERANSGDLTSEDVYDMYRQFYNAFTANGDIKNALLMKAWYLEVYRKSLKREEGPWLERGKLVLWLNRYSNNYGTSIFMPLIWIVLASLFFTYVLLNARYNFEWSCQGFSNIFTNYTKEDYFNVLFNNILNPLSLIKKEDFPNEIITPSQYAIFFLSKIVIAFLIYQFIAAFRRFGKTS